MCYWSARALRAGGRAEVNRISFGHPDVFVNLIDTNADLNQFKKEQSKLGSIVNPSTDPNVIFLRKEGGRDGGRNQMTFETQLEDFEIKSIHRNEIGELRFHQ